MQIDFHHAVTYIVARLAGLIHADAVIVAYAAQYVDDSTNKGTVRFDNGQTYERIASAHETFDVANHIHNGEDYQVWVPFHFLPGNDGKGVETDASALPLIQRLICTPDSPISNDMWAACRAQKGMPNHLHRLGITAHVYADTFAHQLFAGVRNSANVVEGPKQVEPACTDITEKSAAPALDAVIAGLNTLRLGHGAALTFPDLPFLKWSFRSTYWQGGVRNNREEFLRAAQRLYEQFSYYLGTGEVPLRPKDVTVIADMISINGSKDAWYRHQQWLLLLQRGTFSFDPLTDAEIADLAYVPKGAGSWKASALGTNKELDDVDDVFHYEPTFETSNWKHFHDALKEHQQQILNVILRKYGLPGTYADAVAQL